jgi:hypothetical protein
MAHRPVEGQVQWPRSLYEERPRLGVWIAKELEALGHVARVHEWEIERGEDIYAWMERHHDAADHVLCVVSNDYLKAPYSTLERNAALWRAAKRPGFVLLVAVSLASVQASRHDQRVVRKAAANGAIL